MFKVHIWMKRKDGMSEEEFRDYWLQKHAPIARDGYEHLRGYVVNVTTGAPKGQPLFYDGVAELSWESRDVGAGPPGLQPRREPEGAVRVHVPQGTNPRFSVGAHGGEVRQARRGEELLLLLGGHRHQSRTSSTS